MYVDVTGSVYDYTKPWNYKRFDAVTSLLENFSSVRQALQLLLMVISSVKITRSFVQRRSL